MSDLVEKPQDNFQTPYQLILDLTVDRILSRINDEAPEGVNLMDRWLDITEALVDITTPEEMQNASGIAYWRLTVTSVAREIVTTPIRFYTFTLGEYLKDVLRSNYKSYSLSKTTITEGYYYTQDDEIILAVKSNYDFTKGILLSGVEFTPSMFTLSEDKQTVFIDMPVVKGMLNVVYLK